MPDKMWKVAERQLAAIFGAKRRPLSGMTHNTHGTGGDDGEHDTIYLEAKFTGTHRSPFNPVFKLINDTASKALKQKKTPVVGLRQKGDTRFILLIDSKHLPAVLEAYASAQGFKLVKHIIPKKREA